MPSKAEFRERVRELKKFLDPCVLCPRKCGVRRLAGEVGACGAGPLFRIASWNAHHGEEPPISGKRGSGTLFASFCPMKCLYCQNFPFSQLGNGRDMTAPDLVKVIQRLVHKGVHNINLVTHTHFLPQICESLMEAWSLMKPLPVVYNSSGFERVEVLRLLEGIVDIYLPDIRYAGNEYATLFSNVPNYVEHSRAAIREMFRQVGHLKLDSGGLATGGLIVRHLVLPNGYAGTEESLKWLKETVGKKVNLSLMCQYFPAHRAPKVKGMNRKITNEEYLNALNIVEALGFENVRAQDPFEAGGA